jgi:hypothetical protein
MCLPWIVGWVEPRKLDVALNGAILASESAGLVSEADEDFDFSLGHRALPADPVIQNGVRHVEPRSEFRAPNERNERVQ